MLDCWPYWGWVLTVQCLGVDCTVFRASGKERDLARKANELAFNHRQVGLIKGPRHPDSEQDMQEKATKR